MALSRKIEISDFSVGLISDLDAAELPLSASSRLENADVRNKKLETQPGVLEVNTGLPTGFIKLSEQQFQFTVPSEQNCVLVHGTLSGAHKLYIRPYISLAGAWVDAWQELSEMEGPYVMDASTTTSLVKDASLSSTTTDYYKSWILYNTTAGASALITASNSSKELTLSWAIANQTVGGGDTYFICRNPIYESAGASWFAPSSNGCRFLQRANVIDIATGSDLGYESTTGGIKTDLWLGVLNGYQAFDDTDLNFTGFYLTRKPPAAMYNGAPPMTLTGTATGAGEQALAIPTPGRYLVVLVPRYDRYQEGPLYPGDLSPYNGTAYSSGSVSIAANQKLQIDLSIFYGDTAATKIALRTPVRDSSGAFDFVIFDRRITSFLVYMNDAFSVGAPYRPSSEWRMVKEIVINDAAWSGTGANYTQTVYITGDLWDGAEGIDITDRQGHDALKIFANANFLVSGKKVVAAANVYADEQRQSFVFFSAINSNKVNTPNVFSHNSYQDLSGKGISKIVAFVDASGDYVAIGENSLVGIDGETLGVDNQAQAYGTSSANAAKNVNQLIYFASLEDCYYYHHAQRIVRSLMTGFVREAWRALSTSDKQAAAIGFDGRYNVLVIAAGTSIFTYNLPAAFASDLAQDTQAVGSFNVYSVGKTFLKFYTDLTKRCIGIASDGKSYELFSSGVANTMVYEKIIGESNLNLHSLRLTYEASATVTAKIFDMARNESYPVQTYKFPAQSKHRRVDLHRGAQVRRPKLQISAGVGTEISQLVINPQPISDEK